MNHAARTHLGLLFVTSLLVACATAETDAGGGPSTGGSSSEDGGAPGNGGFAGDGGQGGIGTNTVTNNTVTNTVTNNTVTNTATVATNTATTSGGACDEFACIAECFAMDPPGFGQCQGNDCVCMDVMQGAGGGFPTGGFGGAFP